MTWQRVEFWSTKTEWPDPRHIPAPPASVLAVGLGPAALTKVPFAGSSLGGEGKAKSCGTSCSPHAISNFPIRFNLP